MKKLLLLSVFATLPVLADPCPAANGIFTSAAYMAGNAAGNGCNVLITFNANGSVTTVIENANPYDGVEDTLVGVVNNTGGAISSFVLTGTAANALFGFDGDGACAGGGGQYESAANCKGATDPNGYGGPGVTFTGINAALTSGTVDFAGGIGAHGGTSWFSLEEPPSLNIRVGGVPEPSSLWFLGSFVGLALARKKLWSR